MSSYMLFYEMKTHVRETGHQAWAVELTEKDRNGEIQATSTARFTCLNCVIQNPEMYVEKRRAERIAEESKPTSQKQNIGAELAEGELSNPEAWVQPTRTVENISSVRDLSVDAEPSVFPVPPPRVDRPRRVRSSDAVRTQMNDDDRF